MNALKPAVLCSGFGLGFYIPGAVIYRALLRQGQDARLFVFEKYLHVQQKETIVFNRSAYHRDFSVALFAARMPLDIRKSLDDNHVERLLDQWEEQGLTHFISLSGHWGYILERYRARNPSRKIYVDSVFVDSDYTPSWRDLKRYCPEAIENSRQIWLYTAADNRINWTIAPRQEEPIPFFQRLKTLVVHGGGWGMGTYKDRLDELCTAPYQIEAVAYENIDLDHAAERVTFFMNDPAWRCWDIDPQVDPVFPPYAQVKNGRAEAYQQTTECQWLYDRIRCAQAIVSKPGAGSLIDPLASCTPLILLEPFGKHEQSNFALWENLGFGISYETWRKQNFSSEALEMLHENLRKKRPQDRDYVSFYTRHAKGIYE